MSILPKISLSWNKGKRETFTGSLLPPWQYGKEYATPTDIQSLIKAYKSWVYICASRNASSVARQKLQLFATKGKGKKFFDGIPTKSVSERTLKYLQSNAGLYEYLRKGDEIEEILDHPFLDLMKNVNPFSNRYDLLELTAIDLELCGNAYWYLVDGPMGIPAEIWVLPPEYMKVVPDKDKFISGYVFRKGQEVIHYDESEVIHFKFVSPINSYYGVGPLSAVTQAYNINENMNIFNNALFTNMARPDGVLETEQSLTEPEFNRTDQTWKDNYGGPRNAGKIAVLDKGMKYRSITLSPRDLNFLSGKAAARDEIAAAFGVPKSKLTTDDVNRANADAGNYAYMSDTILPRCLRIEEKTNEKLMARYATNLFVAFENPVPEDMELELKERESNLKSGYTSINLERIKNNQEPVEWGEIPIMAAGMVAFGTNTDDGETDPKKPKPKPNDEEDDDEGKTVKSKKKEISGDALRLRKRIDRFDNWYKTNRRMRIAETTYKKVCRKMFNEQEAEVLAIIEEDLQGVDKWTFNETVWFDRFYDASMKFNAFLLKKVTQIVDEDLKHQILAKKDAFEVTDPFVAEHLKNKSYKFATEINDSTEKELRTTLAKGVDAGEGIPDLTKRVKTVFHHAKTYRNERIARTEVLGSYNYAAQESFKKADITENEWLSTHDARTRDSHVALDGQVRKMGEHFSNGLLRPGDYSGAAEEIINCRCTLLPVIPDELQPGDTGVTTAERSRWENFEDVEARMWKSKMENREMTELTKKVFPKLDDDSVIAIKEYTSSSNTVADSLRSGRDASFQTKTRIKRMDMAFKNEVALADKEVTVFRGAPFDALGFDDIPTAEQLQKLVGKVIQDKSFVSTTISETTANGFSSHGGVRFEILCPKGSRMLPLDGQSHFETEWEMLLPRGSKFGIVKTEMINESKAVIQAVLLP